MPGKIVGFEQWRAGEYFQDYYGTQVDADELAAIRFQVQFLRQAARRFDRAIEYGSGPTLMRALAAAPAVERLDMADWLPGNLDRLRQWAEDGPQADNWGRFARYALECEGIAAPGDEAVCDREGRTRKMLGELLWTDARRPHPLGEARSRSYDLLISGFCVDCLTESREEWHACLGNVLSLVRPGGAAIVFALRDCAGYRVADQWFPAARVTRQMLTSALTECGLDPGSLQVAECDLPSHAHQGYEGILMASGWMAP